MADTPRTKLTRSGSKPSPSRAAISRRAELRKNLRVREPRWRRILSSEDITTSLPIALAFALLAGALIAWTRETPLVAPGRLMTETRIVRTEFRTVDEAATESSRRNARQNTPRVYNAVPAAFDRIENALMRLPTALADARTLDEVAPEIRQTFQLTSAELAALRTEAIDPDASGAAGDADVSPSEPHQSGSGVPPVKSWRSRVDALLKQLYTVPLLDPETYQLEQTSGSRQWIEVRIPERDPARLLKGGALNLAGAQLAATLRQVVLQAGFTDPIASMIAGYLARPAPGAEPRNIGQAAPSGESRVGQAAPPDARATFSYDAQASALAQDAAAAAIEPVHITYQVGSVLFRRGDRLSYDAYSLLLAERAAVRAASSPVAIWIPRLAAFGAALLITFGLTLYIVAFCRRIRRNPLRILTVAILLLATLALASTIATQSPAFLPLAAVIPTTFLAAILAIAYDRSTAIAFGSLHAALVLAALDQPAAGFIVALAGVIAAAWALHEVRHRHDLVRAGLIVGVTLACAVLAVGLLDRPIAPTLWREMIRDASWMLAAGISVGVVVLAILPTIERAFDITTGMTLIELRDPKQPLLRELQRRAPGTYNHSLAVAAIAENAAEAVGAKSLHLYIGALYHDIGKMNKPDYFVENQVAGHNRHNKISPAMSLLILVGHVKDGVELAREYNLPRSLHHYIESHHGTTLVEYFFQQAVRHAGESDAAPPDEIEYRYPGPKPRTREAAILMISDAVESATRALKEPAPARIEALVHQIARRRLEDGQFDHCELTLRELFIIEASIIKSLTSIYHARIAYPGADTKSTPPSSPAEPVADALDTASTTLVRTLSQSA